MSLGRSQSHSHLTQQLGQYLTKCRHLLSGQGVHSLHVSSEKLGRQFIRNLLHAVAVDILAA